MFPACCIETSACCGVSIPNKKCHTVWSPSPSHGQKDFFQCLQLAFKLRQTTKSRNLTDVDLAKCIKNDEEL
jgi:hypothetical protein